MKIMNFINTFIEYKHNYLINTDDLYTIYKKIVSYFDLSTYTKYQKRSCLLIDDISLYHKNMLMEFYLVDNFLTLSDSMKKLYLKIEQQLNLKTNLLMQHIQKNLKDGDTVLITDLFLEFLFLFIRPLVNINYELLFIDRKTNNIYGEWD